MATLNSVNLTFIARFCPLGAMHLRMVWKAAAWASTLFRKTQMCHDVLAGAECVDGVPGVQKNCNESKHVSEGEKRSGRVDFGLRQNENADGWQRLHARTVRRRLRRWSAVPRGDDCAAFTTRSARSASSHQTSHRNFRSVGEPKTDADVDEPVHSELPRQLFWRMLPRVD